jgi:hypothetical protein
VSEGWSPAQACGRDDEAKRLYSSYPLHTEGSRRSAATGATLLGELG